MLRERTHPWVTPDEAMTLVSESETEAQSESDRRSNLVLRALIDEMLERVRHTSRMTGVWSTQERERAEAELESIMARVRRVASKAQIP